MSKVSQHFSGNGEKVYIIKYADQQYVIGRCILDSWDADTEYIYGNDTCVRATGGRRRFVEISEPAFYQGDGSNLQAVHNDYIRNLPNYFVYGLAFPRMWVAIDEIKEFVELLEVTKI